MITGVNADTRRVLLSTDLIMAIASIRDLIAIAEMSGYDADSLIVSQAKQTMAALTEHRDSLSAGNWDIVITER